MRLFCCYCVCHLLQLETPFVAKTFRPTPTDPPNSQVDEIHRQHALAKVEATCKEMELYAKYAQDNLLEVEQKVKSLIDSLTSDEREKDAILRKWNEERVEAEQREIEKWEKKMDRIRSYPDYPAFEDEDSESRQKETPKKIKSNPSSKLASSSKSKQKRKEKPPKQRR